GHGIDVSGQEAANGKHVEGDTSDNERVGGRVGDDANLLDPCSPTAEEAAAATLHELLQAAAETGDLAQARQKETAPAGLHALLSLLRAVEQLIQDLGGFHGVGVLQLDDLEIADAALGLRQQADKFLHQGQRFRIVAGDDQLVAVAADDDRRVFLAGQLAVLLVLLWIEQRALVRTEADLRDSRLLILILLFRHRFGLGRAAAWRDPLDRIAAQLLEHALDFLGQDGAANPGGKRDDALARVQLFRIIAVFFDDLFGLFNLLGRAADENHVAEGIRLNDRAPCLGLAEDIGQQLGHL